MALVVPDADAAIAALAALGETAIPLGHIATSDGGTPTVRMLGGPDFFV
jgi:hypothetical protein